MHSTNPPTGRSRPVKPKKTKFGVAFRTRRSPRHPASVSTAPKCTFLVLVSSLSFDLLRLSEEYPILYSIRTREQYDTVLNSTTVHYSSTTVHYCTVQYSTQHTVQTHTQVPGKGAMPPPSPGPPSPPHQHAHAQSTNSHAVPLHTQVPGEGGHAPPFPRTPIPSSPSRTHIVHKLTRGATTRVRPGGGLPPTPLQHKITYCGKSAP
jgi:hypothetical protein